MTIHTVNNEFKNALPFDLQDALNDASTFADMLVSTAEKMEEMQSLDRERGASLKCVFNRLETDIKDIKFLADHITRALRAAEAYHGQQ